MERMFEKADVMLNTDYFEFRRKHGDVADRTVYTGMLDQFFDYRYGVLEYRSVRFETEKLIWTITREMPWSIIQTERFRIRGLSSTNILNSEISR